MEKRLAIDKPKKVRLIPGHKVEDCTLVANKGDYMGRKYGLFGEKLYHEHDVWDFHMPFDNEVVVEDDPDYTRVGDELFTTPKVRIVYGEHWFDDKYFETNEKAKIYFDQLVEIFDLFEVVGIN